MRHLRVSSFILDFGVISVHPQAGTTVHLSRLLSLATTGPELVLHPEFSQSGQDPVSCSLILFSAISSLVKDVIDPKLLQLSSIGLLPLHLTVAGSSTFSLQAVVTLLHQGEVKGSRAVLEAVLDTLDSLRLLGVPMSCQVCDATSTQAGGLQ